MFQRLAVSLPANDSIKQEIILVPLIMSVWIVKKQKILVKIQSKLNMASCQYDQTIKNIDADKGSWIFKSISS